MKERRTSESTDISNVVSVAGYNKKEDEEERINKYLGKVRCYLLEDFTTIVTEVAAKGTTLYWKNPMLITYNPRWSKEPPTFEPLVETEEFYPNLTLMLGFYYPTKEILLSYIKWVEMLAND